MSSILFVCTGNICRSPLAEGIFIHKLRQRGVADRFTIDSAGTGRWHVGSRPDPRSIAIARARGIELPGVARALRPTDGDDFTHLIAMDRGHAEYMRMMGFPAAKISLMRSYDPEAVRADDLNVPDPYHDEADGFERVYQMLDRACDGLLTRCLTANPG